MPATRICMPAKHLRLRLTFNPSHAVSRRRGEPLCPFGHSACYPCLSSARRKIMSDVMHPVSDLAVVTEEDAGIWLQRSRNLDFGQHVCWFCRPFRGQPTVRGWQALIDCLCDLRRQHGIDLVVIDPLASFLPGRNENNATVMMSTLRPLQRLAAEGGSVLLLDHPLEKPSAEGQLA